MIAQKGHLFKNEELALKSVQALDIGCGAGLLSESLGRVGLGSVTGIDPTPKCVELAQAHLDLDVNDLDQRVFY